MPSSGPFVHLIPLPPLTLSEPEFDQDAIPPEPRDVLDESSRSPRCEEVWDEAFPSEKCAGASIGTGKTTFETYRDKQIRQGTDILGPLENEAEWELARWLVKNVGHNQADEFLKLPIVSV